MGYFRRRSAAIGLCLAFLLVSIGVAAALALSAADQRDATAATSVLPPEIPRRDLPKALDGTAFAAVSIGNWIVVGGDFTQIELQDGTIVDQPALFAYDIDSGAFNDAFRPAIVKADGVAVVRTLESAGNDVDVYVGGKFITVDGLPYPRLAKLSVDTGLLDETFAPAVDGPIRDIALHGASLFIGGEFDSVGGEARSRLAKVDATSGAVDIEFVFDITGSTRPIGQPYGPKHLSVTSDGTLVVAHRAQFVNTEARKGIVLIDVEANAIRDWSTSFWGANAVTTVDADVSPDGTYIVVVGDGGDFPFMGRDAAMAFSLTDKNLDDQRPIWISRNFDSTYSVGISDDAVFIGGHFCWVESSVASDPWPGDGDFTNNNSCFGATPASRFAPEVVFREQIAALDPGTGHALIWDPGSNGIQGVQSIEVIDRGLLIGHDGDRFGRDGPTSRSYNVGRHVFLDSSMGPTPDTSMYIDQPVLGTCDGQIPTLTGTTRNDLLVGTTGDDVILAGPGNDHVYGGPGQDVICGNDGVDSLHGDSGDDLIFGGSSRDRIWGGRGDDELRGEGGRDIITGDQGDDLLIGGKASDRLNGRNGSDTLKGSVGPDRLAGGPRADTIIGGAGFDRCAGDDLTGTSSIGDEISSCEE